MPKGGQSSPGRSVYRPETSAGIRRLDFRPLHFLLSPRPASCSSSAACSFLTSASSRSSSIDLQRKDFSPQTTDPALGQSSGGDLRRQVVKSSGWSSPSGGFHLPDSTPAPALSGKAVTAQRPLDAVDFPPIVLRPDVVVAEGSAFHRASVLLYVHSPTAPARGHSEPATAELGVRCSPSGSWQHDLSVRPWQGGVPGHVPGAVPRVRPVCKSGR